MHPLGTVLCASDLSAAADEAIEQAAAIARADDATLLIVHVIPVPMVAPAAPGGIVPVIDPGVTHDRGQAALEHQVARHPAARSAAREVIQAWGSVVDEILARAETSQVGLLVVASHRRSAVERALLGSTALALVRRARCPVLVARPISSRGTVAAATDLSLASVPALRVGAEEARRRRARFIVVHALDLPPEELILGNATVPAPPDDPRSRPAQRRAAEERLVRFLRQVQVEAEPLVADGGAAASIVALAGQPGVELVAIGTTSGRRLEHAVLGSVAEAVVRRAPCPVLTVPNASRSAPIDLLDE
jgi:nucleotide-binding universal stress UspA family protein